MIRYELASDFSISRLLVGLWQIADMEKDGRTLDREEAAGALAPYVDAGIHDDRHGGSLWFGGRDRRRVPVESCGPQGSTGVDQVGAEAGTAGARRGSSGGATIARSAENGSHRSAPVSRLVLLRPELAGRAAPPWGTEGRGPHSASRSDQLRYRPSAHCGKQWDRHQHQSGLLLASGHAARRRHERALSGARRSNPRVRNPRRRVSL